MEEPAKAGPDSYSQPEVKKDEVMQDEVKHEVQPDEVQPDEVQPDEVQPDEVQPDEVKQDEVMQDRVKQDEHKHDEGNQDNEADEIVSQAPATTEIAIDDDYWNYSDYNSDATSFLSQLSSSITDYQWENGRRYHAYQEGRYPLPNDENELDREDMKHHEMMLITEFRLHLSPILENPQKILDLGTGTGIWAIQMAEKYPSAEVIGIDLSPIQPEWVPPNLVFEVDDIEAQWLHAPNSYDLIHIRFMFLAIRDFPKVISQAYRTLKPGGYIELSELDLHPESYDSHYPENSQILYWLEILMQASHKMGFNMHIARNFKSMLIDAGFEDVTEQVFEVPWGGWPKDTRLKTIGVWHLEQLKLGLQGIAMGLMTRSLGWTAAEVEVFLVGLRKELSDKSIHVLDHAYVVHGRKPLQ